MGTAATVDRKRHVLDVAEVAYLLDKSDNWVRGRFDRGTLAGYRLDDGIRKVNIESVRAYMRQHGCDESVLDSYLATH